MFDITDLRSTIIPKSDQLNAEQLLTGDMTVTVSDVAPGKYQNLAHGFARLIGPAVVADVVDDDGLVIAAQGHIGHCYRHVASQQLLVGLPKWR